MADNLERFRRAWKGLNEVERRKVAARMIGFLAGLGDKLDGELADEFRRHGVQLCRQAWAVMTLDQRVKVMNDLRVLNDFRVDGGPAGRV